MPKPRSLCYIAQNHDQRADRFTDSDLLPSLYNTAVIYSKRKDQIPSTNSDSKNECIFIKFDPDRLVVGKLLVSKMGHLNDAKYVVLLVPLVLVLEPLHPVVKNVYLALAPGLLGHTAVLIKVVINLIEVLLVKGFQFVDIVRLSQLWLKDSKVGKRDRKAQDVRDGRSDVRKFHLVVDSFEVVPVALVLLTEG